MSSFTTPIRVEALPDGRRWKLLERFVYDVGELGGGDSIEVPAGFITDMGSVPRLIWNLIDPWGKPAKAFIIHDWLYSTQERSRLVSDAILLEGMGVLGVNRMKRLAIYSGVRIGGWLPWKKRKKELEVRKASKVKK
jgi:hypothetical protein